MKPLLYRNMLTYSGLVVHTASSGPVAGLDTLHLVLDDGEHVALGETRVNCTYLNGYRPDDLVKAAESAIYAIDWSQEPEVLRQWLQNSGLPAPVRMLIDIALWDLSAKRAHLPLAHLLAVEARPLSYPTNQTLFLSTDEAFEKQVAGYVSRGFRDLKLRVGQDIEADCARHASIRQSYGDTVKLAADANGAWTPAEAPACLAALEPYGLAYVEQPIPAGDWDALRALSQTAPMPVMLDESLSSEADVATLASLEGIPPGRLQGHLKLLKLGGLTPALEAARKLAQAGIEFMIGQMNEAGAATAAALHLAVATRPLHAELYGADGLADDPASGLTYADGRVDVKEAPGLGLTFTAPSAPLFPGD